MFNMIKRKTAIDFLLKNMNNNQGRVNLFNFKKQLIHEPTANSNQLLNQPDNFSTRENIQIKQQSDFIKVIRKRTIVFILIYNLLF